MTARSRNAPLIWTVKQMHLIYFWQLSTGWLPPAVSFSFNLSSQSLSEQHSLLQVRENRRLLDQVKDDSSSLVYLKARSSFRSSRTVSSCTESSALLSIIFDFDEEILHTSPYQRQLKSCYRQHLQPSRPTHSMTDSQSLRGTQQPMSKSVEEPRDHLCHVSINQASTWEEGKGEQMKSEDTPAKLLPLSSEARLLSPQWTKGRSLLSVITSVASELYDESLQKRRALLPPTTSETADPHKSANACDEKKPLISANAEKDVCRILAEKPNAAEQILLGILSSFRDLTDLLSVAHANRGFRTIFRRNENGLLKGVLQCMPLTAFASVQFCQLQSRISELEYYGSSVSPTSITDYVLVSYPTRYQDDLQLSKKRESDINESDHFFDSKKHDPNKVSHRLQDGILPRGSCNSQQVEKDAAVRFSGRTPEEISHDLDWEAALLASTYRLETMTAKGNTTENEKFGYCRSKDNQQVTSNNSATACIHVRRSRNVILPQLIVDKDTPDSLYKPPQFESKPLCAYASPSSTSMCSTKSMSAPTSPIRQEDPCSSSYANISCDVPGCTKGFSGTPEWCRTTLQLHKKHVHLRPKKTYYCGFCRKAFSRLDNRRNHVQCFHANIWTPGQLLGWEDVVEGVSPWWGREKARRWVKRRG